MSAQERRRASIVELDESFRLESGAWLHGVRVAVCTWGEPNFDRDNAVLICHALTGSADADVWWRGFFEAPSAPLDSRSDFIVATNVAGSCYGTSYSAATDENGRAVEQPLLTVRDLVALQRRVVERLGIARLRLVIGGSLGGMQALEWVVMYGEIVSSAVVIAAPARHSAWAIGLNVIQRRMIASSGPARSVAAARALAMLTYRHPRSLERRFGRERGENGKFEIVNYLDHHGEKLERHFTAEAYLTLSEVMDSHDIGRGRGSVEEALSEVSVPVLVVGIDSDVLYPLDEVAEVARLMPRGELSVLTSPHGHDAFLIETERVAEIVARFRARQKRRARNYCAVLEEAS